MPDAAMRSVGALLSEAAARLAAAGVPDGRRDARLLLAHALERPEAALIGSGREAVPDAAATRFAALVARRAAREPVARILGRREFWSLDFAVTPAVLDPRPDTETLVVEALRRFPDRAARLRVLDLGTGSGCLLLAVLSERPEARGVGIDRSGEAASVARGNARALGLSGRALIAVGDWAAAAAGPFDLVLSNPPYIPGAMIDDLAPEVAEHDPRRALDGGGDGLAAYRALARALPRLLAPEGRALIELGAGQAAAVTALMDDAGLRSEKAVEDLGGVARCLVVAPDQTGGGNTGRQAKNGLE